MRGSQTTQIIDAIDGLVKGGWKVKCADVSRRDNLELIVKLYEMQK